MEGGKNKWDKDSLRHLSVVKMCFTNEEGKKGGGWEVAENGPNPMAIAWKRNRHFLNIVCLIFAHFLV